ncbi:FecR family protein [Chitinophaga sp. NPDC101104]|uniref:FecR family protein n=1 Tax=Chitinophaga sp. NPDC101104 TaxID=3390561 RepID=UPI003CFD3BD6
MDADRLIELFERYLDKTAGPEDREALAALALAAENEEKVKELIQQSWEKTGDAEDMSEAAAAAMLSGILRHEGSQVITQTAKIARFRILRRIAIAASVLVITGVALWIWMLRPAGPQSDEMAGLRDVQAPGAVKAMITLANGQRIALDSAANGLLAKQGDVDVLRDDNGDIRFADNGPAEDEVTYNTLSNPRGSKVAIIRLADGTRVWLNSASSLRFFSGVGKGERKVELNGEAYFEVAKDPAHRFVVNSGTTTTEVLGTHFNVNSYNDEPAARVTLLEGSVKVKQGQASAVLQPGQQAQVTARIDVRAADTDAAVAWKNGIFHFQDQPLPTVLKQVARWYDIQIVYEKGVPDITFFGEIESNVSLAQMLHLLERSGVRFTMDIQKRQLIIH